VCVDTERPDLMLSSSRRCPIRAGAGLLVRLVEHMSGDERDLTQRGTPGDHHARPGFPAWSVFAALMKINAKCRPCI